MIVERMAVTGQFDVSRSIEPEDILRVSVPRGRFLRGRRIKDYIVRLVQATRNPANFKVAARGLSATAPRREPRSI